MNDGENFAKRTVWLITKRELQTTLGSPSFWIGLICVVAILTVSGPFDTAQDFTALQRFAYWGGIAFSTYILAMCCMVPVVYLAHVKSWNWGKSALLGGLAAGPPVGILVFVINSQIAGLDETTIKSLVRLIILCTVIAIAIAFLRQLVINGRKAAPTPEIIRGPSKTDIFVRRLSPEVRGDVLSLQAQDHYIEVTTTRGNELILMRLGDATQELTGLDGRRVHRSWWVAKAAISALRSEKDRLWIDLKDGRSVPVSRANEKAVRHWAS